MIIEKRIKEFEKLGFGLFVHFGLYSVIEKGEWSKELLDISWDEYLKTLDSFCPKETWADELALTAKEAGCKYITLTTRHHDGFSLYDTCGLNTYDAPHVCGRDLIKEFVDACNKHGIIPFFYHTLLDWHEESYETNFKEYLKYLRKSVEIICKNYGKIGGIWFDGMWNKPDDDWEEDELYSLIRSYQPDAMIINNTGLDHRGELGNIELDSVTFERGRPQPINLEGSSKYIASEMCETLADHWGYTKNDFNFKSGSNLINSFAICRRYRSNFLFNVGPKADGSLRTVDKAALETLGQWTALNEEALRIPEPSGIEIKNKPNNFILKNDNTYYLFINDLGVWGDSNVTINEVKDSSNIFTFKEKIKSVSWLDNGNEVNFTQNGDEVNIQPDPFKYGENLVVRIAKITV
ncbi:MAG: alpha-L-fucosidase [Oscillospiraceae bacterium]|nr:alpha-L-fucosidase [Oscillospiraceae bacterium]